MSALLTNAAALIDDASLLYENTRYPRAYALAAPSPVRNWERSTYVLMPF